MLAAAAYCEVRFLDFLMGLLQNLLILLKYLKMAVRFRQRRFAEMLLARLCSGVFLKERIVKATLSSDRIRIYITSRWWVVGVLLKSRTLTAHQILQVFFLIDPRQRIRSR